jgi:hypothetical protein
MIAKQQNENNKIKLQQLFNILIAGHPGYYAKHIYLTTLGLQKLP